MLHEVILIYLHSNRLPVMLDAFINEFYMQLLVTSTVIPAPRLLHSVFLRSKYWKYFSDLRILTWEVLTWRQMIFDLFTKLLDARKISIDLI